MVSLLKLFENYFNIISYLNINKILLEFLFTEQILINAQNKSTLFCSRWLETGGQTRIVVDHISGTTNSSTALRRVDTKNA